MSLYRASPNDGIAWITGGSSGIGRALAFELVERGYKVAISANKFELFDKAMMEREDWQKFKPNIFKFVCDVTDEAAMQQTCDTIIAEHGPICLAVFNAGTYEPVEGHKLTTEVFRQTLAVNVQGVVNGIVPIVEHMKQTGKGQIAMTASVTSYAGLPTAAAYGPTKAALNSMAQSLKFDFDRMNIRIQVINPGFVHSQLTNKNSFPMPGIIRAHKAAIRIADGFERGGFELRFPKRLVVPLKILSYLPYPLYFWAIKKITGADKPLE